MTISAELTRIYELFQLPFMQRSLLGGVLTGVTGGLVGSFTVVRQLSFFSDALGHSALLGVSMAILLGFDPGWVLLPFAVVFALVVTYCLERTGLWTDALLNIIYSSSIAVGIILLSFKDGYETGISQLLFGDVLAIQVTDLIVSGILLATCVLFLGLTLRSQLLLTLHEPLAKSRGVAVSAQRTAFIVLLSLVVGVAIKAIGVLLISAFVVIPACTARALSRTFSQYIFASAAIGGLSAALGIVVSALFDFPSGPSIVTVQFAIFMLAILMPKTRATTV
ncbi:metal ABC transporter permease [Leptolyngbya cf. ectocarpi LEGE 11479]|uniref:Metal ABC transporter permease n=2 Tax=Leptolyngbya ectocarpi TaxID=1202 RepID=A0A929FAH9_LEPEC|nr:metal ABC transporter permease [Leptolyngbya cf. ectocarpi LEGE 11479]